MTSRLACVAALAVASVLVMAPGGARATTGDPDDLVVALAAYDSCRWSDARAALVGAADAGSVRAGEMLGFMHLYGDTLYGGAIRTDRVAARLWFVRAANGGSVVGEAMAGQLFVADVDWMSYGNDTPWTSAGDDMDWANIGTEAPDAVARRR